MASVNCPIYKDYAKKVIVLQYNFGCQPWQLGSVLRQEDEVEQVDGANLLLLEAFTGPFTTLLSLNSMM